MFILVVGPTAFLLKTSLNSLGVMADNFVRMSFWTDPFTESGFVESWTIFYWAWWIAFAPYIGLFVTRISRGRTIRQVIFGMLIWGSLVLASWLLFKVCENILTARYLAWARRGAQLPTTESATQSEVQSSPETSQPK